MIAGQSDRMLMTLAALALAVLAARAGGNAAADGGRAAPSPPHRGWRYRSRSTSHAQNEYEADRIGFQRLDAAGFDITAMATFMERLQRASRFAEGTRRPTCATIR